MHSICNYLVYIFSIPVNVWRSSICVFFFNMAECNLKAIWLLFLVDKNYHGTTFHRYCYSCSTIGWYLILILLWWEDQQRRYRNVPNLSITKDSQPGFLRKINAHLFSSEDRIFSYSLWWWNWRSWEVFDVTLQFRSSEEDMIWYTSAQFLEQCIFQQKQV